jgi:hypothetical protein
VELEVGDLAEAVAEEVEEEEDDPMRGDDTSSILEGAMAKDGE